jgi:hypothetical protein
MIDFKFKINFLLDLNKYLILMKNIYIEDI